MTFELVRGKNLAVNITDNRVFMSRTIGLIVASWKFNVLKTSIFALEASLLRQIFVLKNIKFPCGNYQPIVPRQRNNT